MLTRLTQLVILIPFLLQNCSMTYGESCSIIYSAQPPLLLECNPLLTLQLQCQAIGNKEFAINWYHNNTEAGNVRKIIRGVITTTKEVHADSDEQMILKNSGYSLNGTKTFSVNSKLAISEIINSLETESYELFYKSLEGSYWCEVDPEQSIDYTFKKSNVLQLKNINTYNNFPICQGIQSVFEIDCAADQKKLNLSSTIVVTPSTYLDVNQTFSHKDPSETTLLSSSHSKATSPSVSPKINGETQQITTIPESQPSNTLSDGNLSNLLNKWETTIICLCAVTIIILLLIAIVIGLYIYMHKRQQIKIETPIALTKFDNPVYNMSEDYIYPVTTNKEDVEIQYDYMCPKRCIKDDIAIYYTKPIGRSDDDYDDCYENLSGGLKNTITKDDDKNNASLSSTSNQYQGLERKTINYLSIYDMLKNKDYSRSNSEENIQSSIIQPPTAILHSNVDREYDYVNIKK